VLDDLGLGEAISDYVTSWARYFGVNANLRSNLDHRRFATVTETALYRILQEALNNIAKHAQAKTTSVVVEHDHDTILLTIQDDGVGFDPREDGGKRKLGLVSMQERAAAVQGSLTVESRPGSGTTVTARVAAT